MEHIPVGSLAVWSYLPKSKSPKARVLIVHGISEHSARHQNTVDSLLAAGYAVVRFDLRGMGKSGGKRQWVRSFDDYVDDVNQVYQWIGTTLEALPLFLLGHSLGGAIATNFAALHGNSLQGLVLSAPAYIVGGAISPVKIAVGKFIEKIAPTLKLPQPDDHSAISRDPKVVQEYTVDPLANHFNTVQQGNEVLRTLDKMPEKARLISTPTFMAHGSADQIIRLEGSFEILKTLSSKDKSLFIIPGGYHEPHNDYDKENYFTALIQWLDKHIALPATTPEQ